MFAIVSRHHIELLPRTVMRLPGAWQDYITAPCLENHCQYTCPKQQNN